MFNFIKIMSKIDIPEEQLEIPKTVITENNTVPNALEVVFGIMGAVAVLFIVISGLQFTLSQGNADKAAKARNSIIYAAVGLVIAMMAFAIVRFVVKETI